MTFIITNAGTGWVELSSQRFLPKLYKEMIVSAHKIGIKIISARSMYEKQFPSKHFYQFLINTLNRRIHSVEN